jgi:hypothetical protein
MFFDVELGLKRFDFINAFASVNLVANVMKQLMKHLILDVQNVAIIFIQNVLD